MAVKKPSLGMIYEMTLAALVIFSLVIDLPARQDQALSFFVWAVFVLDYFVRFFRSPKKWTYIREHPLEFIAMLPLGTTFQAARLIRLIRVIRLLTLMNRRSSFLDTFFEKYHIDKLFLIVVLFMFVSALSMKWIEPNPVSILMKMHCGGLSSRQQPWDTETSPRTPRWARSLLRSS